MPTGQALAEWIAYGPSNAPLPSFGTGLSDVLGNLFVPVTVAGLILLVARYGGLKQLRMRARAEA